VPPDGNMDDYLVSLKKLLSRNEDRFFPTHGPIIDKPKKLVNDYISHRLDRERQIIDAIKKGNNKISDIVKLIYKDVDKSLHPAAAMSTLAHLKRMESNQEVTVQGKGLEGLYSIA
jgi:glyoxylase-like metal-dependent hydrolase (beta-lactamase superfamily II)